MRKISVGLLICLALVHSPFCFAVDAPGETQRKVEADKYFRESTESKDPEKKRALLLRAAELGNPHAQVLVGHSYRDGINGFPKEPKKAMEWYEKYQRTPEGAGTGAFFIGEMYLKGNGIPPDTNLALKWLNIARYQRTTLLGEYLDQIALRDVVLKLAELKDQKRNYFQASIYCADGGNGKSHLPTRAEWHHIVRTPALLENIDQSKWYWLAEQDKDGATAVKAPDEENTVDPLNTLNAVLCVTW